MDANNPCEWPKKRQKMIKKESVIRDAKVRGEEHVNHVGNLVPKRATGDDCRLVVQYM